MSLSVSRSFPQHLTERLPRRDSASKKNLDEEERLEVEKIEIES